MTEIANFEDALMLGCHMLLQYNNEPNKYPRYAFTFEIDRKTLRKYVDEIEDKLPSKIKFYDVNGQKTFELRNYDTNTTIGSACYLIIKE